jgi:hypothetical protein
MVRRPTVRSSPDRPNATNVIKLAENNEQIIFARNEQTVNFFATAVFSCNGVYLPTGGTPYGPTLHQTRNHVERVRRKFQPPDARWAAQRKPALRLDDAKNVRSAASVPLNGEILQARMKAQRFVKRPYKRYPGRVGQSRWSLRS